MNFTITKPFAVAGTVILLLWIVGLALCASTGYLAPLQSGRITELGVCLREDRYTPVTVVPIQTDNLFICGYVSGASKRAAAFYVFHKGDVVAQATGSVVPGAFFLSPLHCSSPLTLVASPV